MDANLLPNPFTPMAWLPPEFTYQMTMAAYICAGLTGAIFHSPPCPECAYDANCQVMVWDIATGLGEDYQLFFKRKASVR